MILMIDNYDSFTYNLVQYLGEICQDKADKELYRLETYRNDKITIAEIENLSPNWIVISPGPGTPLDAGISNDVLQRFGGEIPILGVCLGHQCIGHVYGGRVVGADRLMHGKTSMIHHYGVGIYRGIDNPFEATRYHSLIIEKDSLPACLTITAWTEEGEIMGVRHKDLDVEGVQFHPESILTKAGKSILRNFIEAGSSEGRPWQKFWR